VPGHDSKLAVVTGASKGIGASIAKELAEAGYYILLLARSAEGLAQVADYLQAEGLQASFLPVDLTKTEQVDQVIKFVENLGKDVSVLVHNAGTAKVGRAADMKLADWQDVINLNLTAPFYLTQKLLPKMKEGSQIIMINSIGGKQAFAEWGAYSASKFGLRGFAEALRAEVEEQGIRVTSIYPAAVDTPIHDGLPYDWDREKMMKADDIARAVLYCLKQGPKVRINDIEIENTAGRF